MLPTIVERTIEKLCASLGKRKVKVESIYVYGSITLGDLIEDSRDIVSLPFKVNHLSS